MGARVSVVRHVERLASLAPSLSGTASIFARMRPTKAIAENGEGPELYTTAPQEWHDRIIRCFVKSPMLISAPIAIRGRRVMSLAKKPLSSRTTDYRAIRLDEPHTNAYVV